MSSDKIQALFVAAVGDGRLHAGVQKDKICSMHVVLLHQIREPEQI